MSRFDDIGRRHGGPTGTGCKEPHGGKGTSRNGRCHDAHETDNANSALASTNGTGKGAKKAEDHRRPEPPSEPWEPAVPFPGEDDPPPFPTQGLAPWLRDWIEAEADATQTPKDLAGLLALATAAGGIAGKVRVRIRDGWSQPTNLYTVVALLPGERKSAVFADALHPVDLYEQMAQEKAGPEIARKASEHRVLEARLKAVEQKAAKAEDPAEREQLAEDAKRLAQELAEHDVPDQPVCYCDDETVESLARLIYRQGGRMFQASAEGGPFEICKGRYSDKPNFDVYLKAHDGDPLKSGRISRERESLLKPALSCAMTVQPDVIRGLAEQPAMKGRGFLARWAYGMPRGMVGRRKVAAAPVPVAVEQNYTTGMLSLWSLEGAVDDHGRPVPHWLQFSRAADEALREFERWREPLLAEGEELSHLAGWAEKSAGTVARIAAILHMAATRGQGVPWNQPVSETTVATAIRLVRDYLLPHAQIAFGIMGADSRSDEARKVWLSIVRHVSNSEGSEYSESAPTLSRRDIHQLNRRQFPTADDLDPVLEVLQRLGHLRLVSDSGTPGRGHKSPSFDVNPLALAVAKKASPRTQRTQCTHSGAGESACVRSEDADSRGAEEVLL